MANDRAELVEDALLLLVDAHLPALPGEDEDILEDRRDEAAERAREILENHDPPQLVFDITHTSDQIKNRLLRNGQSPDKAVRFSHLLSRLLTQPVLSRKAEILDLFYSISDLDANDVADSPPRVRGASQRQAHDDLGSSAGGRRPGSRGRLGVSSSSQESSARDAFRIRNLPSRPGGQRVASGSSSREQKDRKTRASSGLTKPSMLADNYPEIDPPETALLRDLPFTLQGVSSTNLTFTKGSSLTLPPTLPIPIISILHTLAEPSLLYRGLSAFVQSTETGLIGQSLQSAIGRELQSYLGLVATLEGEIRRALAMLDQDEPRNGIGKAGVTLKRCVVWTREATMGLRLMSLMVEESKSKKGGQLISMVHGFSSSHGDPFVGAFAERLLSHITRPFYDMLRQWIYDGELSDPYLEFFVIEQTAEQAEANGDGRSKGGATSVWEDKYKLDHDMIPSIITTEFAKKVFLIGKSLNFIRYGCGDSAWVESYSKAASKELHYGDTALLDTSIGLAYKTTMARLIHLMADKFKLFDHLKALKKFLLLGQGDFIALLMESLSSNLDRPTNTLYRHNLTAQLEHAIRGSNAQYETPDVLRRLDARMLEFSHGEIGWDAFTLEYKIDAPVDVIVSPWGNKQYLKVFNFLWRVKRVEFALGTTWRRCMTGARGVLAAVADVVGADWKIARCSIAEMIHFVCQLQYYILFEVIESSWDQLQASISKPECTLDDLIEAHTKYLKAITHKGLLGSARASSSGNAEDSFLTQLHSILKIMLAYKDAVDGLYSYSVAEFTKRQDPASAHRRTKSKTHNPFSSSSFDETDDLASPAPAAAGGATAPLLQTPSTSSTPNALSTRGVHLYDNNNIDDPLSQLSALRSRLASLAADFKAKVNILLGDLAYQPDVDMRFLGVVMNFNDVYDPVRRKGRSGRSAAAAAAAAAGTATATATAASAPGTDARAAKTPRVQGR